MNRNRSSDLGRKQSEGNLGNERNRGPAGSSESSRGSERMRNRSGDAPSRGSSSDSSRSSEDWNSIDDMDDAGMPSRRSER